MCPSTWDPLRIAGVDTSGLYDIIWEVRSIGSTSWTQLTASDDKVIIKQLYLVTIEQQFLMAQVELVTSAVLKLE